MKVPYKVLLPNWLIQMYKVDPEGFKTEVVKFVRTGRPEYKVLRVEGRYALCERRGHL
ncbi:hypothetical protein [Alkalicoccobacillus plakortidis]|uniref:Uncharacterized protein n=1 Tax=Alkalicoccobacillus plakortidis TaxID=444060 RepID=A0ABT0XDQ7_9BACI|nr:hypothetical protein [Alkalicoccobacillus plakortidis]MCM2674059.1 hypothetical protein [Alkalicoccobacillus plakortidis]